MKGGQGGEYIMARERKVVKDYKKSIEYIDIKKDLLDQLDRNGIYGKQFKDLVNDYMSLWIVKSLLIDDIKSRGVSIKWNNGGGQSGFKKNDSIAELNKTNAQMLKLLNELGIKATVADSGDDDEL